ncbi:inositol-pentakisphosphate 2-kinase [Mycena vulgaris]|nr:inositol-pentakisphosphate 2-kinase [Mycena vulgaris]
MPHLTDTKPEDWTYLSEGGATIVFSYVGQNPDCVGTVLRLRKSPLADDNTGPRMRDNQVFASVEDLAAHYGIDITRFPPPPPPPRRDPVVFQDPTVIFQKECIARLIPAEFLPRLEPLDLAVDSDGVKKERAWLETLAHQCQGDRPSERRQRDGIEMMHPTPVLATDLVGGEGIAVEIKPKWGFLPSPTHLADSTRAVKTRTCRFCMHSHLKTLKGETVAVGYCPLDLYSGNESRIKTALSSLWDAWETSNGAVNSFKVFVRGKKISPAEKSTIVGIVNDHADPKEALLSALLPVLKTHVLDKLSHLQRTLDSLDIEGLAALISRTGQPLEEVTLLEYTNFINAYLGLSPPANDVRSHTIACLLSATFKDCSIILRVPDGKVMVIDLDSKRIDRLPKWEKLDQEIAHAYMEVPEAERKVCVDARAGQ